MAKRRKKVTATPRWLPDREMWRLAVQCNGQRRDFYSPEPGKRGRYECIEKAEHWINGDEDLLSDRDPSVRDLYAEWLKAQSEIVGTSTYLHNDEYGRNYILPAIGHLHISQITNQQQLQSIINKAYSQPVSGKKHLSKKSLQNLRGTIVSFMKYARSCGLSDLYIESLTLPRQAEKKEKCILQPNELRVLFSSDVTTPQYGRNGSFMRSGLWW